MQGWDSVSRGQIHYFLLETLTATDNQYHVSRGRRFRSSHSLVHRTGTQKASTYEQRNSMHKAFCNTSGENCSQQSEKGIVSPG